MKYPQGPDDDNIEDWGEIIFKDPTLLAYRIMFHIESFKTIYIATKICISVMYLANNSEDEQAEE